MRTYGTVRLQEETRTIFIRLEPQVAMRFKRVFPKIEKGKTGVLHLSCTPENCRDLDWFMDRYPLECDHIERIWELSHQHQEKQTLVDKFLNSQQPPLPLELAIPAREYQLLGASMFLATGALLLADDVGLGKAQPITAKVLTPVGWVEMGSLQVGDAVIDPDGGVGNVTAIFDRGEREVFSVATKDGASTECCDEHLWLVKTPNDRCRGTDRVLELKDIRKNIYSIRGNGNRVNNFFLPIVEPVSFAPSGDLPLSPYLLGIILGDGSCRERSISFSSPDEEILDWIQSALPQPCYLAKCEKDRKYDWRIVSDTRSGKDRNPVITALRALGQLGRRAWQKHIPSEYLSASIESRLELLRGLMDSDGTCGTDGVATFCTTSPRLAKDFEYLVGSLGGFASHWERTTKYPYAGEVRTGRVSYNLNVRIPVNPFRLKRKAERWHSPLMARAITSVVSVGVKQTRCIAVSTKRRLYVTDGFIVTHNTATAIAALTDPRTRPAVYVTLTHLPLQVQRMIGRFAPGLTTHVIKTGQPYDVTRQRGKTGPYPDVVILSYSKLSGWADTLAKVCRCVIWDEVQELRHSNSYKHDAALVLTEAAKFRMGMSATPIYNYGGEIFNVMRTIAPDALGNWDEFYTEWCGAGGGKDKARIQNPAAFGSYLRENGLMLRRTRKDVKRELPPCFSDVQHVEADIYALDQVSRSCAELAEMLLSSSGRGFDKMRAASDFDWRLRQATGIAKAPYVADFVRLLVESGEKVVLYGWHHAVYAIWRDKLKDIPLAMYTGEESPTQKEAAKHAFTEGDAKVLIMSLRSGAGLDGLQGSCNIVCFGELDWSPGVHEQAIGRVWRDGQENQVNVYFMVSDEGSDPFMVEVNGVKEQQIKGIRDPDAEMVQKLQVDPDRVKELARRYLKRSEVTV